MIYLEKVFNFTLRSNEVRLDIEARCANPPAPMLQAMGFFKERIARNVMEGGYTEMKVIYPIHLTEPQGIIKNCLD